MQRNYQNYFFLFLLLLGMAGCSNEGDSFSTEQQPEKILSLQVSADGFSSATADTRAAQDNFQTTFERDDCLGLIITTNGSIRHVPCRYNGYSGWDLLNYDAYYYDNQSTYQAYFPYKEYLDGLSLDDVKTRFMPQTDQSSKERYAASDLMVCENAVWQDKTLKINFTHCFSLLVVHEAKQYNYTLSQGNRSGYYYDVQTQLSDVVAKVGDTYYRMYRSPDRLYRAVVPAGSSVASFSMKNEGKPSSMTPNGGFMTSVAAGSCYKMMLPNTDIGDYNTDAKKVRLGDYFCVDGEDKWYLVPGEMPLTESDKCIGIVFYAGKHSSDGSDYSASGISSGDVHGYVVALTSAGNFAWEKGPNSEDDVAVGVSTSKDDWNGYSNQKIIEAYTTAGWNISNFPAAKACADWGENAPANSSGWFLPSAGQLKAGIYSNKAIIESALTKAGGYGFGNSYYWSSTEGDRGSGYAWCVYFGNDYVLSDSKYYGNAVRAVLAF